VLVAQQSHNVAGPIVDGHAVSAALQVLPDSLPHLRRKVAFQVIRKFFPDLSAVDFYNMGWGLHRSSDRPMREVEKGDICA
jgi:hypothetical protein